MNKGMCLCLFSEGVVSRVFPRPRRPHVFDGGGEGNMGGGKSKDKSVSACVFVKACTVEVTSSNLRL